MHRPAPSRPARRHPLLGVVAIGLALAATPIMGVSTAQAAPAAPAAVTQTASTAARAAAPALVSRADAARVRRVAGSLRRLRGCESGGDYRINTGNGYYGAYQFDASTWRSLGFRGMPHTAAPAVQDAAAARLQARRGWGPWPSCSGYLGLR